MLSKSQIKLVKSLKHKKYRNNYNLFIVEGLKGILEAKIKFCYWKNYNYRKGIW